MRSSCFVLDMRALRQPSILSTELSKYCRRFDGRRRECPLTILLVLDCIDVGREVRDDSRLTSSRECSLCNEHTCVTPRRKCFESWLSLFIAKFPESQLCVLNSTKCSIFRFASIREVRWSDFQFSQPTFANRSLWRYLRIGACCEEGDETRRRRISITESRWKRVLAYTVRIFHCILSRYITGVPMFFRIRQLCGSYAAHSRARRRF